MNFEILSRYYGTDIIGWLAVLVTAFFLAHQKRSGFLYGLLSNISLILFGILSYSLATIGINILLAFINIRGYIVWGRAIKR